LKLKTKSQKSEKVYKSISILFMFLVYRAFFIGFGQTKW